MKRVILFCVVMLALPAAALVAPASSAPGVTITLDQPVPSASSAQLTGKVSGRNQVTIEQWQGWYWRAVMNVTADGAGTYKATVPATTTPTTYRARAWVAVTPAVTVVAAVPEPEPENPASTPTDACGPRLQRVDGTYWSCTLGEDFNGTQLNRSIWMPQTIFRAGSDAAWACYLDDPSVISVSEGALHLSVRKLPQAAPCSGQSGAMTPYVSGMVTTYRLFSQQYGRFEARIKSTATTAPGLHEAFWLWPDDRFNSALWPAAGEIDISETYSTYPDLSIPFLHYTAHDNWGPVPGLNTAWNCVAQRGVFNTYTLEWTASRLAILVNGKTCMVNTSGDPAFRKPYIVAFTQALGAAGNEYDGRAPLPATMSIDYLRVWK